MGHYRWTEPFNRGIKNYLAVDGIENVINILEELELGKIRDMEFLGAYACTGGCVGGAASRGEMPLLQKTRIKHLAATTPSPKLIGKEKVEKYIETGLLTGPRR